MSYSSDIDHRLPKTVIPYVYRLFIDASRLDQFLFSGTVDIELEIHQPIDRIVLNSVGINIDQVEFRCEPSLCLVPQSIDCDEDSEQVTFRFGKTLQPGYARLYLRFQGTIDDQLHGFYRTRDNGQIGACTQFEPGYARRAFPCFDEPCFKARFYIRIRSPKRLTTLSNMSIASKIDEQGETQLYEFHPTPIMSTYLVAFVIGSYDFVEKRDRNNVLIRVYTPVGKKEQGLFALDTASKILPFYADYFDIQYPLNKLDMIAIADFGAGAMENWGLITFQETYLLVDNHLTSQETKQEVALIVAHEIAHQWFGNLVTMEWWNDLWLNEDNFATWIQFLAVDHVYPEFDVWTQFLSDNLGTCMIPDALRHSHPIEMPIKKPTEIDEIFDDITYEKGSSVIRFLHAYIGDSAFRTGLSNYLAEFAYRNTKTENLWSHLSETSQREDLSEILSTWTKQMGYPLLTVQQRQEGNDRWLTIEQQRFLADGSIDDSCRWKIPISICTNSNPTETVHSLYLNGEARAEFLLEKVAETDWIKLNLFSVGIYRVFYPSTMLDALIGGIQEQTLSPQDRYNIQSDVFALAIAGRIDFVEYLKLLRHAYRHEDNLTVWKSILNQLNEFNSILNYATIETSKTRFQQFLCDFLVKIYSKLEWDPCPNEGSQAAILRGLVLTQMGLNQCKRTIDEARKRFQQYFNQRQTINPNIRSAIYLTVAKNGDQNTFEQLKSLYEKADNQEERIRLLVAICRFDQPTIQQQALEFLWNANQVRKQDHLLAFSSLAAHNRHATDLCWTYMKNHWEKIEEIYGEHDSHLIHFVEKVPALFVTDEKAEEVLKFYQDHQNPFLDRPMKKVLERIKIRGQVLERNEAKINEYLRF